MISQQLHTSREAVREAKDALKEAEGSFDHDRGLDDAVTARLIADVRAAENALADANAVVLRAGGEYWGPRRRYI
jgi:hypothetical protein